jgi:hypothetical protein
MKRVFVACVALVAIVAAHVATGVAVEGGAWVPDREQRAALTRLVKCRAYGQNTACVPDIIEQAVQANCKERSK